MRRALTVLCGPLAAFLVGTAPVAARAARPMITDDARLVEPKRCQVETWVRANRARPDELWAVPSCNPTGNLELAVGGALSREAGALSTGTRLAQAKTLLRPLRPDDVGWGLVIGVAKDPGITPEGNLIDNVYAYLPASWSIHADAVVMHANLGALHDRHASRNRGTWGLGTEIALGGRLQLIAETFGEGGATPFGHAGLRWWLLPDRLQVDTTYGTRLAAGGRGERWFSVGLRWVSAPWLP
jgi:hypothetical protein